MRGKRVGIVGVGNVGSSVAYSLAMSGSCHEVILRANNVDRARGKALDLSQAAQAARKHTVITVAETLEDVRDCDVVVITAGFIQSETVTLVFFFSVVAVAFLVGLGDGGAVFVASFSRVRRMAASTVAWMPACAVAVLATAASMVDCVSGVAKGLLPHAGVRISKLAISV